MEREKRLDEELSPIEEIERSDMLVELAALDEEQRMFDPDVHPKPPSAKEEGTTDIDGDREVDMMHDTPNIDEVIVEPEPVDDIGIDID